MYGLGFKHINKDNFMVIDGGYDVKNLRVKLLKADMQKALRERGMDDSGKKAEVLARFIRLTETVPKYRGVITERKAKFIPLEEAIPDKIIKKTKITPYIRLEEAIPDKIIKKTIANEPYQTMYNEERNKIRNAVSQPKAKPKPPPAVRPRAEPEPTPAPKAETNLPPLKSDREQHLDIMKNHELKQIIKEKGLKSGNKEHMIKKILESEGIQKGVDWDKTNYSLYEDLEKQHYIYKNLDEINKEEKELEANLTLKNRPLLAKIKDAKRLLARDLQKEYDARQPVSQPKAKPKPPPAVRPRAEPEPTPSPKAETNLKEDQFIEEFNTPWASTALSQYNPKAYEALEKLIEKTLKKEGVIDIDLLLSKGVQIPISTVKKIVMKYGLIETLVYTYDLLKSINSDIQPIYAPEINNDFNKSRTFKALKLKPPPERTRKGKGFFKHLEKDYFRVEEQGIKDIKNVKVKVLKADMQKAIKDSGLPLSSTGTKDEVTKNFIRLINARTYPRSAFKPKAKKPTNRLDILPDDVLMLINKFALGNPSARLIKKAEPKLKKIPPLWVVNRNKNPNTYPVNPYRLMNRFDAIAYIESLDWPEEREDAELEYMQNTRIPINLIINPDINPDAYPFNPYADFDSYEEAQQFIQGLPWPPQRKQAESAYLDASEIFV